METGAEVTKYTEKRYDGVSLVKSSVVGQRQAVFISASPLCLCLIFFSRPVSSLVELMRL